MRTALTVIITAAALALPLRADAKVVRLTIEHREPFAGGVEWGPAGAYERLTGVAYFEVDPHDSLNGLIVDVENAPRNARGLVEFTAPFFILKPVDLSRSNGKI